LGAAAAAAEAGLRVADQLDVLALGAAPLATSARVAVRRGELAPALSYLTRAQHLVADGFAEYAEDIAWALALYQDCAGEPRAAVRTLRPVLAALPGQLRLFADEPGVGPQTVRIALRAGAAAQAEGAVAAARQLALLNPGVASVAGAAAHAEGLLRGDLTTLRAALRAYRASPRLLDRASALEDTGLAEDRAGRRTVAVELLTESLGLYQSCTASRDAARVQRRLRRLGMRTTPPAGATAERTSWNSLTAAELRVVRLVVKGMRNREVAAQLHLSTHTIDTHLRHAFAKLGISSRVQLTRYALAQAPSEDPEQA
jgi:DNA-binding CsgD family transcriptional regulator